ncbi:ribonuclease T [Novosphingobium sp. 1949]|uniref:Ribonuclease T n=1 Tax=Novosphingobium organovorum TaxID=2930092 RepID=A0ABT0BFE4_9SPHN|nr:ribonuclease T [Novosphingobium organovorum]MCJ2183630.1 ribonuclease T [Novosphingobium organovorum]
MTTSFADMRPQRIAFALLLGLSPQAAEAQAYQCQAPRTLPQVRPVTPDGPTRTSAIAGYTLAASWSPDWCKTHHDTTSMQCAKRYGRFGFILHGLWPEAARGPSPQWCGAPAPLPRPQDLRAHLCMTPSAPLLVHEWAKHGRCMTPSAPKYFKVGAILWRSLHWPDADQLSRKKGLTAGDFRDQFLTLNPGWPRAAIGLRLSRSGWLGEVRLCYGKDFRPTPCPASRQGPRDGAPMKIWRGL